MHGGVICNSHSYGYNSDPYLFRDDSLLYVFWRECGTPLCDSLCVKNATVGVCSHNGVNFSAPRVYLTNNSEISDVEQAPVLIKHNDKYLFYATWYQYAPMRRNKGIAIWSGTSLLNPDFHLTDTIPFTSTYTVDKVAQLSLFGTIFYLPKPHRFDLWHFDLFTQNHILYMVASEEKGDVVMLAESHDWKHFSTCRTPIINNHYMENYCGYRQYYYKPSAFIQGDTLHLFYTTADKSDNRRNRLTHGCISGM